MNNLICKILVIMTLLISSFAHASNSDLIFTIDSKNIEKAWIQPSKTEEIRISIKLSKKASHELTALTANNIGSKLNILFQNKTISSSIIKAPIKSGVIVSNPFKGTQNAEKTLKKLQTKKEK
ncbi:MAG: hypothetical protein H7A33_07015 [Deltaproteobacteria bacterium]|nr:hypothetical protein [Deltaproteobacteria bacterium]